MLAEYISLKIFADFGENPQEIGNKLIQLIPFDIGEEKIPLNRNMVYGFNREKIVIFEIRLIKKKHIRAFLEHFKSKLDDDLKSQLLKTLNERLDDECNFYIRLSKLDLIYQDRYRLTTDGKCLHITINIAIYPKKRENALQEIKNYLQSETPII